MPLLLRFHALKLRSSGRGLLFAVTLAVRPGLAVAAEPTPNAIPPASQQIELASTDRAWSVGVTEDRQHAARKLFVDGNALLKESFFKQAIQKYREALTHWNHPGIHYNLALALINLEEPLQVRQHLLESIQYGAAPLDEKKLEHGRNYLKLIEQQLAMFEVSCQESDAIVVLDGQQVLRTSGKHSVALMPGEHHITVTKPGYVSRDYNLMLFPGRQEKLTIRIFTEEQLIEKHRRWPFWLPVAVTATGVALVGTGWGFLNQSNKKYEKFDSAIEQNPSCDSGCTPSKSLAAMRDTAGTYKTAATVALATGAATFTGGTVMLLLNMTVSRSLTPEERERLATVQPVFSPNAVGFIGTAKF